VEDEPDDGRPSAESPIPGLLRLGTGAYLRTAMWGLGTGVAVARRVGEAVRTGQAPTELLDTVRDEALDGLRRVLGVADLEDRLGRVVPAGSSREAHATPTQADALRYRAEELLRRSADVRDVVDVHPAFLAIVEELAPDETRILRLLVNEGPQAVLDFHLIELSGEIEKVGRVSFVGTNSGLAHPDEIATYLDNLDRLGLVRVARTTVDDENIYEVLASQPEADLVKRGGLAGLQVRPGRRSLELTDMGRAFTAAAIPARELSEPPPEPAPEPADKP
jgi:hypothetical protein